jgi:hypothetical protein
LSHNGSSDLDVRWLGEALTECVQRYWLLEDYEKKKDGKKAKRSKKRQEREPETKENSKRLKTKEKARTAAE